jgi:DnaJ-class molecular chaperone
MCTCKVCDKEFEQYKRYVECNSCEDGVYESTTMCYGGDVDYIRCPFCKGQGDYDIIESSICSSCRHEMTHEDEDDIYEYVD